MIYLVVTSANIENNYFERKNQFIKGLESIYKFYNIKPFIIECVKNTDYLNEDFLSTNNISKNYGINEFLNVENFFKNYNHNFDDNDDIIKMNLRYELYSNDFLEEIKKSTHDIYCKSSADIYGPNDIGIHTFLFSMKYKLWKEFFLNHFDKNVHRDSPVELQFSKFVRTKHTKFVNTLGILANPNNHKKIYRT